MSTFGDRFGDVRSLVQRPATPQRWASLCEALDGFDETRLRGEVLPYLERSLVAWPAELRVMPERWMRAVLAGRPPAGVALVRQVSWPFRSLGEDAVRALASAEELRGVTTLNLRSTGLSWRSVEILARAPLLERVTALHLDSNRIGARGLRLLLTSARLRALRALYVGWDHLRDEGVEVLVSSPVFAQLEVIDLQNNHLRASPGQHRWLAGLVSGPRLRELRLGWNDLGDAGVLSLLSGDWSPTIERLGLEANELTWHAVSMLADDARLHTLRALDLYGNHIDLQGAAALARSPLLTTLHTLDLSGNPITDHGAQRIADAQHVNAHVRSQAARWDELGTRDDAPPD